MLWKHLAPEDFLWETCIYPLLGPRLSQEQMGSLRNYEPAILIFLPRAFGLGGGQAEECGQRYLHCSHISRISIKGSSGVTLIGKEVGLGLKLDFNSTLDKN